MDEEKMVEEPDGSLRPIHPLAAATLSFWLGSLVGTEYVWRRDERLLRLLVRVDQPEHWLQQRQAGTESRPARVPCPKSLRPRPPGRLRTFQGMIARLDQAMRARGRPVLKTDLPDRRIFSILATVGSFSDWIEQLDAEGAAALEQLRIEGAAEQARIRELIFRR